jgi:hypothetical protein
MVIVLKNIEKVKDEAILEQLRTENFGAVTDFPKSQIKHAPDYTTPSCIGMIQLTQLNK